MLKGYIYNKEIGGDHKPAAVYVETAGPPDIPDDTFIEKWNCPHCGAIKSVYKTEVLTHTRCSVCFKRSNQKFVIEHQ